MRTRLFCPILAAAVAVAAMLGSADRADAAIRITISDGSTSKVFYSNDSTIEFATTLGELDAVGELSFTNFPGAPDGGILTQQVTVSDMIAGGPLTNFFFTADVIGAVSGFGPGVFEVTGNTAVTGAPLARFTLPDGTNLGVTSRVVAIAPLTSTGSVQNNTTVEGVGPPVTVQTGSVALNVVGTQLGSFTNNADLGYTLSSQVVLLNASPGVAGLVIQATSAVTAPAAAELTPEPASLAVWGLGSLALVLGAGARRFRKTKA
jgi:hypothetical protein